MPISIRRENIMSVIKSDNKGLDCKLPGVSGAERVAFSVDSS